MILNWNVKGFGNRIKYYSVYVVAISEHCSVDR